MHPSAARRRFPAALWLTLLVVSLLSGLLTGTANAETAPPLPVTVTATGLTNAVDGSTVHIHVDAQSPPNPSPSQIFGVEARICPTANVIDYAADFNPSQLGKCAKTPLSVNSDALTSVATAPPNATADLDFRVGIGTQTFDTSFAGTVTITCGPANPCKVVVKLQVPGAVMFTSFPIGYAGAPTGDWFHPLSTPTRILDSRPPPESVGGFSTPWGPGTTRDVVVRGGATTVPASADAVVLNATVTGTSAYSFLTVWPKGDTQPTASNLNWKPGQTIPNAVTVKVGTSNSVSVFNNSGNANVIFDVVGYYDTNSGDGYTSLTPTRILDSRPPPESVGGFTTPWGVGTTRNVTVAGGATPVPADADAVVLNATVTGPSAESFLTIWPAGASKPTASSLNFIAGQTIPNAVTVKVGAGGQVSVFNNSGNVNVIFDVVGYFKASTGDAFHPLSPSRILDSRPAPENVGTAPTPWTAGAPGIRHVAVTGSSPFPVPSTATAVLTNVTVTSTSNYSFLTVWPTGDTQPTASSLNWAPGDTIANAVTAKVGSGGTVDIFNNSGTVNVIADVAGYYGP